MPFLSKLGPTTSNSRQHSLLQCVCVFLLACVQALDVNCRSNSLCEEVLGEGAQCNQRGVCEMNNPFAEGCLHKLRPGWTKKRVCNSEDPPDAAELGVCRESELGYMEVRLGTQNWLSAVFQPWILQIILSEMLDVPTTLEPGTSDGNLNFYDSSARFEFGNSAVWAGLNKSTEVKDCRKASREPESYESCAHACPEIWNPVLWNAGSYVEAGMIEPLTGSGALGVETWFMTRLTVQRDPTLLNYWGLQGEENRRKLANTFLRPTTWKDYCDEVSRDNCTTDDGVAARAPLNETEVDRMFVEGIYTGHFRKTEKNDCDKHPTTCTGSFIDYPCGWTSFATQQMFWLGIALESDGKDGAGGYSYQQILDVWAAANATKSNIIGYWFTPDPLYQQYEGTDNEFVRVTLPSPTQECIEHRVPQKDRCFGDNATRLGDPRGACDAVSQPLQKAISIGFYDATHDPSVPDAIRSPGYRALKFYSISSLQIGEMIEYHNRAESPRHAICQWVIDNFDFVAQFIPQSYPRVLREGEEWGPLLFASTILGGFATLMVLYTAVLVARQRDRRVITFAQIEFLWILIAGLLAISVGAVVVAVPPTDITCVAVTWLVLCGYTLELTPLIVKVAAINQLMHAAQQMRRVVVKRRSLFGAVAFIMAIVVVYLVLWTVMDPPHKKAVYKLSETTTADGDTVVLAHFFCDSESVAWWYIAVTWIALLLVCATVLAVQTRKLRQDFNESQTLAMMVYTHVVFLVLIIITLFLSDAVSPLTLSRCQSLIYSLATLATVGIYFMPKFATSDSTDTINIFGPLSRWMGSQRSIKHGSFRRVFKNGETGTARITLESFEKGGELSTDFNSVKALHRRHENGNGSGSRLLVPEEASSDDLCVHCGGPRHCGERQPLIKNAAPDGCSRVFAAKTSKIFELSDLSPNSSGEFQTGSEEMKKSKTSQRSIAVPPGKLGIIVDECKEGLMIRAVESSSLLYGLAFPGDMIVSFGGVDTTCMDVDGLADLIENTLYRNKTITISSRELEKSGISKVNV